MKIKRLLLPIIALAIMVALGACSNEELMPTQTPHEEGHTLLLTAAMPGDGVTTRVGLTQEANKSITLTWEADDELKLVFVQGDTKVTNTAKVASMSADKKKATFKIQTPKEIDLRTVFDLYGVYGAGVIDITGINPIVTLPLHLGTDTSLDDVQNRKDVMLSFSNTNIDITQGNISTAFTHLGSLFCITIKNTHTESFGRLYSASLNGIDNLDNQNWAYNTAQTGAQSYDLVKNEFQNPTSAGNEISFRKSETTLLAGHTTTFWGWNPPLPTVEWPKLQLELSAQIHTGQYILYSANALPARDNPTAAGKTYYFYVAWDGTEFNFTDESFSNELTVDVAEMGTLNTLLSATQKSITKKLTLTGQINKADYDVMKSGMPSLTHVDLSQVISYEGEIMNKIPDGAFGDESRDFANEEITSITLPTTATSIGANAFDYCYGLTGELILPTGVTMIGNSAFKGCYNLTGSLTLPTQLETIGDQAFDNCFGFTGPLKIPDNVTSIGDGAFYECSSLSGTLTLPEGLKTIGSVAFIGCEGISGTVVFPSSLQSIGELGLGDLYNVTAFQFPHTTPIPYTRKMLTEGKTVEVPSTAAAAKYSAASGWSNHPIEGLFDGHAVHVATKGTLSTILSDHQYPLADITNLKLTGEINKADYDVMKSQMPNLTVVDLSQVTSYEGETVNKIPDAGFEGNYTITTIFLPETVTVIGNYAFSNCEQLSGELILPNGLEIIGDGAFYNCSGFTGSLIIPDNVTTIGYGAFTSCEGFNGSLILPKGLTIIGNNAFSECANITGTVTFPSTLTSIGEYGFFECNNIEAFQFPHTTPIAYTEDMLPAGTKVKVPAKAVAAYKAIVDWHPRHPIVGYMPVEVEVPPL